MSIVVVVMVVAALASVAAAVAVVGYCGNNACNKPAYDGVYTSLGNFSVVEMSTGGIVSLPKRPGVETSSRELSEDASFGIGTLLVVEQSSLENRPRGGDKHRTLVYRYTGVQQKGWWVC